jgi:single-stranded DNA-specific DHH superfamily exonuclease
MKIFYHGDDDGRCSAAIVNLELCIYQKPAPSDFIEYNYDGSINIDFDAIQENEQIFIVDLSLNDDILDLIRHCHEKHCDIVHIDHHATTISRNKTLIGTDRVIMDDITTFYREGISASLLTYIFTCMTIDERKDMPAFDLSEGRTHLLIGNSIDTGREYKIPLMIRWIDDYDVWIHYYKETMAFHYMSMTFPNKAPYEKFWEKIYDNDVIVYKDFIEPGMCIMNYVNAMNKQAAKYFYEDKFGLDGKEYVGLCYNGYGNSSVFGDKFKEYDLVVIYHEEKGCSKMSVYSHEDSEFDCARFAELQGGGGHKHAAGFRIQYEGNIISSPLDDIKPESKPEEEEVKEEKKLNAIQRFVKKLFRL